MSDGPDERTATAPPDPRTPPTYWAGESLPPGAVGAPRVPVAGERPESAGLPAELLAGGADFAADDADPRPDPDPRDSAGVGYGTVDDADLDLLDAGWTPPQRVGRVTLLLAAGLVAALGFAGGALVQRNHDSGLASSGAAGAGAAARAFARGGGFGGSGAPAEGGAGGFGSGGTGSGAGGFGPGTGGAGAGTAGQGSAGGGTGSTGSSGSGVPVVVGTVLSVGAGALVVENFAGTKVTVHVPATAAVTTAGLTGLRPGVTVSVTGTKAADGSVTATSVTSRGKAG